MKAQTVLSPGTNLHFSQLVPIPGWKEHNSTTIVYPLATCLTDSFVNRFKMGGREPSNPQPIPVKHQTTKMQPMDGTFVSSCSERRIHNATETPHLLLHTGVCGLIHTSRGPQEPHYFLHSTPFGLPNRHLKHIIQPFKKAKKPTLWTGCPFLQLTASLKNSQRISLSDWFSWPKEGKQWKKATFPLDFQACCPEILFCRGNRALREVDLYGGSFRYTNDNIWSQRLQLNYTLSILHQHLCMVNWPEYPYYRSTIASFRKHFWTNTTLARLMSYTGRLTTRCLGHIWPTQLPPKGQEGTGCVQMGPAVPHRDSRGK